MDNLTRLNKVKGAALYRAEWVEDVETVVYAFTQAGAMNGGEQRRSVGARPASAPRNLKLYVASGFTKRM